MDHSDIVSLGEKYFGEASTAQESELPSLTRCRFTGSEVCCFIEYALIVVAWHQLSAVLHEQFQLALLQLIVKKYLMLHSWAKLSI